jgi:glycosyltransferase involved in cell wall biosynthesis
VSEAIPVLELLVSTRPGGGPQHVLALARGLRGRGWEPIVAGPPGGAMLEQFRASGLQTVALRTDRLAPLTLLRLRRLILRHRVRLVHSHGKGAGLHGRLAARLTGVPAIHTFHGIHYERYPVVARTAYLALERRLSGCTRIIVNVSYAQEREGLALRLFRPGQSRVVRNGIDVGGLRARALARPRARAVLGVDPAAVVVGSAARLDEVKRLDLLLRAAAVAPGPPFTVVLIGGGPEDERLRRLAGELGLHRRVIFPGEVADAAPLLTALDVFAAPSRKEGLPLGVLEAMALGLPVLASDIPAHREVLGDDSGGLVAATVQAFSAGLAALVSDAGLRARLAVDNATRAAGAFDLDGMVTALEAVYREALGL